MGARQPGVVPELTGRGRLRPPALAAVGLALLLAASVLAPRSAAAEPEPLIRRDEYWRPGRIGLELFWQRMRDLTGPPAFARVAVLPPERRGDRLFGVNNALIGGDAAPLFSGVGAAVDRFELRWDEVEARPGEPDFGRIDRLIANAERWELRPIVVLIGAPGWAVDRPERRGAGPPSDWAAWERFVAAAARRYRGRVAAWQVWNEPNIPEYWRGSVEEYARLLRSAERVLRREDPGTPVLTGGMVQDDGVWLAGLLRAACAEPGCAPPFDAVAWHVYNNPRDVPRVAEVSRRLVDRPVWITEANVPVRDAALPFGVRAGPDAVSPGEQAAFVLQLYALARSTGVETALVYRAADADGHYWGLVRQDLTIRPAFLAYRTAARWLADTRLVAVRAPAPDVTEVELARGGERVHVLWNDGPRPATVDLPADASLLVFWSGASLPLRSGRLTLPPAAPAGPLAVPLGEPIIVVAG